MAYTESRRPSAWSLLFQPKLHVQSSVVTVTDLEVSPTDGKASEGHVSSVDEDNVSPLQSKRMMFMASSPKERRKSRLFSVSTVHTTNRTASFAGSLWSVAGSELTTASSFVTAEDERVESRSDYSKEQYAATKPIHTVESAQDEPPSPIAESPTSQHFRFGVDHPVLREPFLYSRAPSIIDEPALPQIAVTLPEEQHRFCQVEPRRKLQKRRPLSDVNPELKPERQWYGKVPTPDSGDGDDEASQPREPEVAVAAQTKAPLDDEIDPLDSAHRRAATPAIQNADQEQSKPITFHTTQLPLKVRPVDTDGSLRAKGRQKILTHKSIMQASIISINGFLIFGTWHWLQYYYIFLPLICAPVVLNVCMVFSIIIHNILKPIWPVKIIMPKEPESLVLLIPCYNETKEEMIKSLDSLINQQKIENHPQAIIIICDGKVRGPGMDKTTGDYLFQDILLHRTSREYITGAYTAWDQQPMDIVVQRGMYKGLPYYCIVKQQNQGKRDSLIVARSFCYNFNRRNEVPQTVFAPKFFDSMASFMLKDAAIQNVMHLVGMDADTVFDDYCIYELLQQSRYPNTVGVCGYVAVDWKDNKWDLWRLYQSAEYTIAQGLRRLHQSLVTHKVSCLPGCCQLLRICEETCGDDVLVEKFGYCPNLTDGLITQIRATASEDRNHVCHMLIARPKAQTRQALKAKAYTDVPHSWSVFLSQRRRWSLGATSNDVLLMSATSGVQWFERLLALTNVTTWFLNLFIFAAIASFIYAATVVPVWIVMCFVSVMLIPILYYLIIPLWLCNAWIERIQFWLGCCCYIGGGPFINIFTLLYACVYMDSFGWGKTRKVVADDAEDSTKSELERLAEGDAEPSEKRSLPASKYATLPMPDTPTIPERAADRMRDLSAEEKQVGG